MQVSKGREAGVFVVSKGTEVSVLVVSKGREVSVLVVSTGRQGTACAGFTREERDSLSISQEGTDSL